MELHPELSAAGGFCAAQGNVGGKNTSGEHLGRSYFGINAGENFRLAVSPPKLSPRVGKRPGRSALQSREARVLPG